MSKRPILLTALCAAAGACGGDGGSGDGSGLTVTYKLSRAGINVECSEVREVTMVRVTVLTEDGLTALGGYPKTTPCGDGSFTDTTLVAGKYTLRVQALGTLSGDPMGVLFAASRQITLPDDAQVEISLRPEVATLALGWSYETEGNFAPCAREVAQVTVLVSGGTGQAAAFTGTFGCRDEPDIPRLLPPQLYTIQITAESSEGFPLYRATEMKALDRGDNNLHLVLAPTGGKLTFDWSFAVGSTTAAGGCGDPMVGVTGVRAMVTTPLGDEPVIEQISCDEARPYTLLASRFTQGRPLLFELDVEGVHHFHGEATFMMPAGDKDLGLIVMRASGTATIALSITATSACANGAADRFTVRARDVDDPQVPQPVTLEPDDFPLALDNVPYGTYEIEIAGRNANRELCRTSGRRSVSGRTNAWDVFRL